MNKQLYKCSVDNAVTDVYFSLVTRPTLYLVSSLLVLQLMSGLGVTSWGVLPTLTECWPWGRLACQVSPWSLLSSDKAELFVIRLNIKRPLKSAIYITPRPLDCQCTMGN